MRKMQRLGKGPQQNVVQFLRRGEVVAEWFLDDDACALGAARLRQLLDDVFEEQRRNRQVMRGMLRVAQLLAKRLEGRIVAVVAVDVAQQAAELVQRRRIEAAMLLQAVLGAGLELIEVPAGLGDADDRHVEVVRA